MIGEDMVAIMTYLAQEPTIYPDAWGYRDAMAEHHRQWRDQATSLI